MLRTKPLYKRSLVLVCWHHGQIPPFHGRPSATTDTDPNDSTKTIPAPFNAASSSASNLGPTSKALQDRLADDRKALDEAQPGLAGKTLPADVLTTSGSGLDPDITPGNANLQIERIAKARGAEPDQIAALVARHTTSRSLGIFGEPRVNVLELNLELEKSLPARETKENPTTAEATPAPAVTPPVATAPEVLAPAPAPERPAPPPAPEAAAPPIVAAPAAPPIPEAPAAAPPPINPPEKPVSKPVVAGVASAVFPSEISAAHAGEKPSVALLKTCSDQYHANAKTNSNGGVKWNAYWKECKKRLKG